MKPIALVVAALMALAAPAWASYDAGWYAYTVGDFALAHSEWNPLAEAGDARAQYQLGVMYQKGEGVAADAAEAARLAEQAAKYGNSEAQYFLGALYHNTTGYPRTWSNCTCGSASSPCAAIDPW